MVWLGVRAAALAGVGLTLDGHGGVAYDPLTTGVPEHLLRELYEKKRIGFASCNIGIKCRSRPRS